MKQQLGNWFVLQMHNSSLHSKDNDEKIRKSPRMEK